MKLFIKYIVFLFFVFGFLLFAIRGNQGDPIYYQKENDTKLGGPFEASNSTSRYALTESIVENHSFALSHDLAQFSSPDVVDYKGKYFTIFTPGVSLLGVPFYILGKFFMMPQLFTYFLTVLLSIINVFLVSQVTLKLGANKWQSLFSGLVFLFATNALGYSQTFTQHHLTVTLMLMSILISLKENSFFNNILLGGLFGLGILTDIPNALLLLPIGIYMLSKNITISSFKNKMHLTFNPIVVGLLIGIIPFVAFFGWYNLQTTGSFTQIGQTIGRSTAFGTPITQNQAVQEQTKMSVNQKLINLPFETRNQLNGFYTLLISNERAWIFYSPIVLVGILGLIFAYKRRESNGIALLLISIISLNIILYSMFGDPWGGWAFGPRYLIPSAALLCAALGLVVRKFRKNYIFIAIILVLLVYSVFISTIGALTTNSIPPKIEAIHLNSPIPYTYEYNFQLLNKNQTSSLIYNLFLSSKVTAATYAYLFSLALIIFMTSMLVLAITRKKEEIK